MKQVKIAVDYTSSTLEAWLIDPNNVLYFDGNNLYLLGVRKINENTYLQTTGHVRIGSGLNGETPITVIEKAIEKMKNITFYEYLLTLHDRRLDVDFDIV
jgi:hypothetical protein